jgi:uncharacterized protein (AIM24 family)
MQKITGPGFVFLELDGHCMEYSLAPASAWSVNTGVLALMEESCQMDIQMVKGVKNMLFGGEGCLTPSSSARARSGSRP